MSSNTPTDSGAWRLIDFVAPPSFAIPPAAELDDCLQRPLHAGGGALPGRPGTRLFEAGEWIIKARAESAFASADEARAAALAALAQERGWAVHSPRKTWLILAEGGRYLAANLSPRAQSLESCCLQKTADTLGQLAEMHALCAHFNARTGQRLDDGLSNFGIEQDGRLVYLDDEVYRDDQQHSFALSLAVLIRRLGWLDASDAATLGRNLVDCTAPWWSAETVAAILAELRSAPTFGERQESLRSSFLVAADAVLGSWRKARRLAPAADAGRPAAWLSGQPFALLGDIHGNWPAYRAVLDDLATRGIERVLVLGDIVGYGPFPARCIAETRARGFAVLKGNHDHAAGTGEYTAGFSRDGRAVIEWTRQRLSTNDLAWLAALPEQIEAAGWLAVHGAPMDPQRFQAYVYRMTWEDNLDWLKDAGWPICFHGHTHLAAVAYRPNPLTVENLTGVSVIDLAGCHRPLLISPGSVGQSREGSPQARYGIFRPAEQRLELLAVDYDVEATVQAMAARGLPEKLVDRLRRGA